MVVQAVIVLLCKMLPRKEKKKHFKAIQMEISQVHFGIVSQVCEKSLSHHY